MYFKSGRIYNMVTGLYIAYHVFWYNYGDNSFEGVGVSRHPSLSPLRRITTFLCIS